MFNVNKVSYIPICEQIISEFERYVMAKLLNPDDKLPSVRQLSIDLSVNPNTIQKAYTELDRSGLCYSVPGNGRFVSKEASELIKKRKRGLLDKIKTLSIELKSSGISINEVISVVNEAYTDGEIR